MNTVDKDLDMHHDELDHKIRGLIGRTLKSHPNSGFQVSAYYQGRLLVNICMGYADPERKKKVERSIPPYSPYSQ